MAAQNYPCLSGRCLGYSCPDSFKLFKIKIDKMDSKICFEMSFFVVEAIRGRCASLMILTATVSEICRGQTNVGEGGRGGA